MRIIKLHKGIYHISFKKQGDLCRTFLRFQEYYESPRFKGKIFTLEEFKPWYIKNSRRGKLSGKFTYYTDWNGFNIPSYILKPFYAGKFDPLSNDEKRLLKALSKVKDKKFYIIATFGNADGLLRHEIAHGLYYTNSGYKKNVDFILKNIDLKIKKQIFDILRKTGGYNDDVLLDEMHAYILSESKFLKKRGFKADVSMIQKKLIKAFDEYYN